MTTWMELGNITLREISQRERQMLCDLSYTWELKKNKKATLINTDW